MQAMSRATESPISDWLRERGARVTSGDQDLTTDFLEMLRDLPISKRRQTTKVPESDRCRAVCEGADRPRCTRRKKSGQIYCGTHLKGRPHGTVDDSGLMCERTRNVVTEEHRGIVMYVDADGASGSRNIYNHVDVIQNRLNPRVVGQVEQGSMSFSPPPPPPPLPETQLPPPPPPPPPR